MTVYHYNKKGDLINKGNSLLKKKLYDIWDTCIELDFDPFKSMIEWAKDENQEMSVRLACAKEIAARLLPALKSVELKTDSGTHFNLNIVQNPDKKEITHDGNDT